MPGSAADSSAPLPPQFSRRHLLRGVAAAMLIGTAGVSLVGCSSEEPEPEIDPLVAQLALAKRDAAAATAAAADAPELAAALTIIANQRTEHAEALEVEISRLAPDPTTTSEQATEASATDKPVVATVDSVRLLLEESASSAAELTSELSGYRAGLMASISACCHVQREVVLP
ncbi:MAG: hypothetical protein GX542_13455 [Rhodococcus sp.]|nr:hypothetical protein [Rhodococcus sp. (in: high G+C Gram-positive bacteria)]